MQKVEQILCNRTNPESNTHGLTAAAFEQFLPMILCKQAEAEQLLQYCININKHLQEFSFELI